MPLVLSGTSGVPAASINGQLPDANAPSGSVIQVIQGASSGLSAAGTSFPNFANRATLCTVSITPTSSSSQIFLIYSGYFYPYDASPSNSNQVGMIGVICRNGTPITGQNGWEIQISVGTTYTYYGMQTFSILDSPGTGSQITYTFGVYNWAGNNASVQLRETSGYLVAMEIRS